MSERTSLTPSEELAYQLWLRQNNIRDADQPGSFYDYRGYFKNVAAKGGDATQQLGDGLHFTDVYKQHGHPTFSVESQYSRGPQDGGRWLDDTTWVAPPNRIGQMRVKDNQTGQEFGSNLISLLRLLQ